MKSLLPFQEEAVKKMLSFLTSNESSGCYNACEMGLGKTIQAITAANKLHEDGIVKKVLIICPAVMRLTWKEEIKEWCPYPKVISVWSQSTSLDAEWTEFPHEIEWVICSYNLTINKEVLTNLLSFNADLLIFDEAHYLKNYKSKRTRVCLDHLWNASRYRVALSGTPFTTRIVDGFTLFNKLAPNHFPNFWEFANKFSYQRPTGYKNKVDYHGVKKPEILSRLMRDNFYIRYTKKEVLTELPDKVFQKIVLPSTYSVDKQLEDAAKVQEEIENLSDRESIVWPTCVAEYRRMQGMAKVAPIAEFIENLLDQEIPVVLFAYHRDVIAEYAALLSEFKPRVITGDTPGNERQSYVEDFQRGDSLLFIGQMIAAGVGITLTKSSHVVMAEMDWSPATINQAIDRCHRIGQKDTVNVYYFVVENSIDETLTNTVMNRARVFKRVLDEEPRTPA